MRAFSEFDETADNQSLPLATGFRGAMVLTAVLTDGRSMSEPCQDIANCEGMAKTAREPSRRHRLEVPVTPEQEA
jgi:hypothetical protein